MDTYLQYFKSLHSLAASMFVLFLFAVTQVFGIYKLKKQLCEGSVIPELKEVEKLQLVVLADASAG